ncbi:MAG: hypothetical protein HZA46_07730, partial [Planctomycetales bacterium]|nr:hypothetical protein [Planctomycetales bacterium]
MTCLRIANALRVLAQRDRPSRRRGQTSSKMIGILSAGLLLLVLLGGVLWRGKSRESLDEPPDIDSSATSPSVARAIKDARQRVLVQPRSAEAWGRLGMLLLAHEFDEQANTCLIRAAELNPQEFRWPYLLGLH